MNATAVTTRTVVTRSHTATLPDGTEVDLPHAPCDHIDPVLTEDGNTLRFAVLDEYPCEHEWSEGVEFVTSSPRRGDYESDIEGWLERVNAEPTLDVYSVDVYEHGNIMFSLSGTGPQCAFDTARGGACIAVPNMVDGNGFTNTEEAAAALLEEYTSWCNGDVYFVTEMTRDPETGKWEDETLGGYVGWDYTEQVLKEGF